jgi:xanthine dehydrogenase accessory factor
VYEISLSVSACLRAGTRVDVAWAVQTRGFGGVSHDPNEALALTPGGGRIGAVASGAANDALSSLAGQGGSGVLVNIAVSEFEAQVAGLPAGGEVRCLLVPATDLPAPLWDRLRDRDPVGLVVRLDADHRVTRIDLHDQESIAEVGEEAAALFGRSVSSTSVTDDTVVSVFFPVPRLVVVGAGPVGEALRANAELLGWRAQVVGDPGSIAGLSPLDSVVVAAHDLDLAGAALTAALRSEAGYIGSLGSRRMQEARTAWLAYRGVTDTSRVHGPAGLDIGARTPAEIAVAILAEALAVRAHLSS